MSNCSEERLRRWKANAVKQARVDICIFSGDEEAWNRRKAERVKKAHKVRQMMKAGNESAGHGGALTASFGAAQTAAIYQGA